MTSTFERLPYEVLDDIAARLLFNSKEDLRQLQLTSKRCQSIAEKHLFKELIISESTIIQNKSFLEKPQRCSYVRTLVLDETPCEALDSRFFERFRNIEKLEFDYESIFGIGINWKYISETLTPEHCKLKELPTQRIDRKHAVSYFKMLRGHMHTLESLRLNETSAPVLSLLAIDVCKPLNFPRLKSLSVLWRKDCNLQELCTVIDKCPSLETLRLEWCDKGRALPWTPTTKHQGLVNRIVINNPSTDITNVCTFLAAKFPNVQEWKIANFSSDQDYKKGNVVPFERYARFLHLAMESMKTELNILTIQSSIPKVFDFLKVYGAAASITIDYRYPMIYNLSLADPFIMVFHHSRKQSTATFTFPEDTFGHLKFLGQCGRYIQKLKLTLQDYDSGFSIHKGYIQKGGPLAHILSNCPLLKSLEYRTEYSLDTVDYKGKPNKRLKKLTLACGQIGGKALMELSHAAPSISDLTIESNFDARSRFENKTQQITINMPMNRFDKLTLKDASLWNHDCNILIHIVSSITKENKYYLQRCDDGRREDTTSVTLREFESHLSCPQDDVLIIITCQSIEQLEYHFDDCKLSVLKPAFHLQP